MNQHSLFIWKWSRVLSTNARFSTKNFNLLVNSFYFQQVQSHRLLLRFISIQIPEKKCSFGFVFCFNFSFSHSLCVYLFFLCVAFNSFFVYYVIVSIRKGLRNGKRWVVNFLVSWWRYIVFIVVTRTPISLSSKANAIFIPFQLEFVWLF